MVELVGLGIKNTSSVLTSRKRFDRLFLKVIDGYDSSHGLWPFFMCISTSFVALHLDYCQGLNSLFPGKLVSLFSGFLGSWVPGKIDNQFTGFLGIVEVFICFFESFFNYLFS